MTAPAFKAVGTGSETSLVWPTHAVGNLALVFVETASETVTTPTGCTIIPGFPVLSSSNTKLSGFYKFAASTSEAALAIPGGTPNHAWGVIVLYENVHLTKPFHAISTAQHINALTGGFFPAIKTLVDSCKVVNVLSFVLDATTAGATSPTNASLSSVNLRNDTGTITGNGGGIVVIDGNKASAGDVDQTTVTLTSTAIAMATIALNPIADSTFSGTVEIDDNPAPNDSGSSVGSSKVYLYDKTQPAASFLCASTTISGGAGAYSISVPFSDHVYIPIYEQQVTSDPDSWVMCAGAPGVAGSGRDITHFSTSGEGGGSSGYSRGRLANP